MDDFAEDCLLGISDCLSNKSVATAENADDNEAKNRLIIERGREDIIGALRQCLSQSERKLEQQRALVDRAIASLTNPESAGDFGVADWSKQTQATPALANQKPATLSVVSASIYWQRAVADTWLLLLSVTSTSPDTLPCPSILLDQTDTDLQLTYKSHVIRLPFPKGCCDDPVSRQQPPVLTSAHGLTVCVSVDVSEWTDTVTLHVLLSGCLPPYDTYQVSAGCVSLSPSDRLTSSYQPLLCDTDTCTALWSLCSHYHHVHLTLTSTIPPSTTRSTGELVDQCLAGGGCGGFTRCKDNSLIWANLDSNHVLFGCLVFVSDVDGSMRGSKLAQIDSRLASSIADSNISDACVDDNIIIDFSQDYGNTIMGASHINKNTSSIKKQQQQRQKMEYSRCVDTKVAHRCFISIYSRTISQLSLVCQLLGCIRCGDDQLRQLPRDSDDSDARQKLADLIDRSRSHELDPLRSAIECQCAVASEIFSPQGMDYDVTRRGVASEDLPNHGDDVTRRGVTSEGNALSSSELRFSGKRYRQWRAKLELYEIATARAVACAEIGAQLEGGVKNL